MHVHRARVTKLICIFICIYTYMYMHVHRTRITKPKGRLNSRIHLKMHAYIHMFGYVERLWHRQLMQERLQMKPTCIQHAYMLNYHAYKLTCIHVELSRIQTNMHTC